MVQRGGQTVVEHMQLRIAHLSAKIGDNAHTYTAAQISCPTPNIPTTADIKTGGDCISKPIRTPLSLGPLSSRL